MKARTLALKLKEEKQDFEFYPTTPEIIQMVRGKIQNKYNSYSVLDCGAGDGRVLMALTDNKKYAIEKSRVLVQRMDPQIFVIGSDFWEQTLIDKKVDVIFSNPPYSEFEDWAVKIISEAMAGQIFLVLPERWKNSKRIEYALTERDAQAVVIGHADFKNAERPARAVVDVLSISLDQFNRIYNSSREASTDSFKLCIRLN